MFNPKFIVASLAALVGASSAFGQVDETCLARADTALLGVWDSTLERIGPGGDVTGTYAYTGRVGMLDDGSIAYYIADSEHPSDVSVRQGTTMISTPYNDFGQPITDQAMTIRFDSCVQERADVFVITSSAEARGMFMRQVERLEGDQYSWERFARPVGSNDEERVTMRETSTRVTETD